MLQVILWLVVFYIAWWFATGLTLGIASATLVGLLAFFWFAWKPTDERRDG